MLELDTLKKKDIAQIDIVVNFLYCSFIVLRFMINNKTLQHKFQDNQEFRIKIWRLYLFLFLTH